MTLAVTYNNLSYFHILLNDNNNNNNKKQKQKQSSLPLKEIQTIIANQERNVSAFHCNCSMFYSFVSIVNRDTDCMLWSLCSAAPPAAEDIVEEKCRRSESDLHPAAALRLLLSCRVRHSTPLPPLVRIQHRKNTKDFSV